VPFSDLIFAGNPGMYCKENVRFLRLLPNRSCEPTPVGKSHIFPLRCCKSRHCFNVAFRLDPVNLIFVSVDYSDAGTYRIIFTFKPTFRNSRSILINTMHHIVLVCRPSAISLLRQEDVFTKLGPIRTENCSLHSSEASLRTGAGNSPRIQLADQLRTYSSG
jgi:hypothetical protein